ncbi:TetR/AcrR family transcriptional regulator [Streptomyces monticola]|uniref:TetR/AcrR family transcriptional regulator n=1 Tax=Streptomyces monticola TaxID=2666263 RepID=A0ABW2JI68_9ACTN
MDQQEKQMPDEKPAEQPTHHAPEQSPEGAGQPRPRRRQARGERRIAQLLEAAATVFGESGYSSASTNAIARTAGVSPGTLYQFFPNKEAIAVELGERMLHQMRDAYGEAFTPANIALPLPEMLDAIVDRFVAFNCRNPAFMALMHGSDVPGRITEEHDALHASLVSRIQDLLAFYLPDAPPGEHARIADLSYAIFKGGLELVLAHEGPDQEAYIKETKQALLRYLEPVIGDKTLDPQRAATPPPTAPL